MSYPSPFDWRARAGVRVTVEPSVEPISLVQARLHLRLTAEGSPPAHPDDAWLTGVGIPAARDFCEQYTGRSIGQKTLQLSWNRFPAARSWQPSLCFEPSIALPFGPVRAVTEIAYVDANGDDQTIADGQLVSFPEPAQLKPAFASSWPVARDVANAVRITYTAGYTLGGDSPNDWPLPSSIRAAMLLTLGHLYENRESTTDLRIEELPLGVKALLEPYVLTLSLA